MNPIGRNSGRWAGIERMAEGAPNAPAACAPLAGSCRHVGKVVLLSAK
jgi:hypothetical protein